METKERKTQKAEKPIQGMTLSVQHCRQLVLDPTETS